MGKRYEEASLFKREEESSVNLRKDDEYYL